jgi:hypothetical protein
MALSYDELLKAAEDPNYIDAAKKQAESLAPIRKGLGTISPKSLLGQAAALGQYGQGGLMDAAGFTSALFNFPELSADFKEAADDFYEKGKSYGEDYGQGFYKIPEIINDSDLNEQLMALVPTAGFEGGVEQEMSTEEAMMGMPGPAGLSNAQAVQEAIIGATPAFEKSGRGDAPVKEEKFFTGEGKPKPGEMMDTDFLNTFEEALLDTGRAKGDTVTPETKEDLLEKYKKEFYEATGLDSSGKVDKSAALMALGLSLMQNKAGKGFNVGKMLSAVGEAGEKALPALEKAISTAKAEGVAAGKYALSQIEKDEASAAASRNSHLKHLREMELEHLKADLESRSKVADGPKTENFYTKEYTVGAKPLKIRMMSIVEKNKETGTSEIVTKFQSPSTEVAEVSTRYANASAGYGLAEELKSVLNVLNNQSATSGGQVFKLLSDRGKNLVNLLGITSDNVLFDESTYQYLIDEGQGDLAKKYKENPTTLENKAQVAQDALMARFKRFMTQETGNGISVYDSEAAKVLTGKISLGQNLNKNLEYIDELQGLFGNSVDTLDDVIMNFYDRDYYQSDKEYEKTIKKLNTSMNSVYAPLQINQNSNQNQIIDVSE